MTNGIDETYERTVQIFDAVADSQQVETTGRAVLTMGTVPAGQNWLVERISLRYRPGGAPTDPQVYFLLSANSTGASDFREGTQLLPSPGFVAGDAYDFFADEASPVRFYAGEAVLASAKLYGAPGVIARLVVILQVRATQQIAGAGQSDTTAVEPVAAPDVAPAPPQTWG